MVGRACTGDLTTRAARINEKVDVDGEEWAEGAQWDDKEPTRMRTGPDRATWHWELLPGNAQGGCGGCRRDSVGAPRAGTCRDSPGRPARALPIVGRLGCLATSGRRRCRRP